MAKDAIYPTPILTFRPVVELRIKKFDEYMVQEVRQAINKWYLERLEEDVIVGGQFLVTW
jgi:hypothetical protein